MSKTKLEPSAAPALQQVAAEVLEFGQALFEAVNGTAASPPDGDAAGESFLAEEMRAAVEEFFHALRMLQDLVDA